MNLSNSMAKMCGYFLVDSSFPLDLRRSCLYIVGGCLSSRQLMNLKDAFLGLMFLVIYPIIYMTVTVLPSPGHPEMSTLRQKITETSVGNIFDESGIDELSDNFFFLLSTDDLLGFVVEREFFANRVDGLICLRMIVLV
jgi:hypothetical protein